MTMFFKNYFNIPKCNTLIPFITFHYFFSYFLIFWFSHQVTSNTLWPHELQHARLACPSLFLGVCSNSCPLNQWCHLTVSSSVTPLLLLHSIFPNIRIFSSALALCLRCPRIGDSASASASVLPMNIHGWFPLGLTDLASLLSKGLSRVSSNTGSKTSILWQSAFTVVQLLHLHITTGKNKALVTWIFVGKMMTLLFNTLSRFTITFLPRSKCLFISWLQLLSTVFLEPKKIKSVTVSTFSHLFAMKWWDLMPWSSFFECWGFCVLFVWFFLNVNF